MSREIMQYLRPKVILFQATRGLEYLHSNGFVHRNVKPSSFLIKEIVSPKKGSSQYVIKITDFRLSRNAMYGGMLSGTVAVDGWEAPESRRWQQNLKPSLDVFILGCFFHYVVLAAQRLDNPEYEEKSKLETPLHPFNSNILNIVNQNFGVYNSEWQSAIKDQVVVLLIKKMLQYDESKRPTLTQVLEHQYFQTSTKELYPIYSYDKPGWCVIFSQEVFKKVKFLLMMSKHTVTLFPTDSLMEATTKESARRRTASA